MVTQPQITKYTTTHENPKGSELSGWHLVGPVQNTYLNVCIPKRGQNIDAPLDQMNNFKRNKMNFPRLLMFSVHTRNLSPMHVLV